MEKRFFAFTFLLLFTCIGIYAQAFSVKGRVIDSTTADEIPGAICVVYSAADSTREVSKSVSADDGRFVISLSKGGDYTISIHTLGMDRKNLTFVVSEAHPVVDLGSIALEPSSTQLDEVTVTARRPVIQANGERVTYNMQEDPQSQNATVIEMLKKVPLVTVDGEDNIKVNGQSSFKIFVNGKENPMLSANAKLVLKAMPAASVKKIEVITEPGAKYDAEGTGGILNIVTETSAPTQGFLATLRGNVSNNGAGAGIYAVGQIGKVTASVNYNYSTGFGNQTNEMNIDRVIHRVDGDERMEYTGILKNKHNFHNGSFDLSWEPDSLNLFNVSGSLFFGNGKNPLDVTQSLFNAAGDRVWSYSFDEMTRWRWGSASATASYQHNFSGEGHNLVASYMYTHGISSGKDDITYKDSFNYPLTDSYQLNDTKSPTNEHTLQIDYTNPFNGHHTLETGAKAILRRNSSRSIAYRGASASSCLPDESSAVDLSQRQDVAALYASYTATFGKWSAKGGLRYEHTYMAVDFTKPERPQFSTHLNDVVPNAAVSFSLAPASNLRLAYQMRITRPGVSQLNPFRDNSNPLYVSFGNPNLTSERNHSVQLTYSNFVGKVSMNISASYSQSSNRISEYSYTEGITQYRTYANTGTSRQTSLNAYLNFNVVRNLQWSLYGQTSYSDFKFDKMNLSNHGWSGFGSLNITWTMPYEIRLNGSCGLGGGNVDLQSKMGVFKFYSLSLSKSLLKEKRLELSLSASNFFGPMHYKADEWTDDSHTHADMKFNNWSVGLSVSYRFGGLSKSVKKTASQIVNDDVDNSNSNASGSNNPTSAVVNM